MPISTPVNLLAAGSEMGVSAPVSLLGLRRSPGGATPNTGPNTGVPQSGQIGMLQLVGASGTSALAAFKSGDAVGSVFMAEPAPMSVAVASDSTTITASGGTGSYSYNWAYLSGDASIAITGGTTGATHSWSKTVSKNTTATAVWRCTVNDGVNTVQVNVSISLTYQTDL